MSKKKIMNEEFPKRLERLRVHKGLTKKDMIDRLKLPTVSSYANWEYGQREPEYNMLVRLADFHDVSIDYLLGRTDSLDMATKNKDENDLSYQIEKHIENIELRNWLLELITYPAEDIERLKTVWDLMSKEKTDN